jgi:hypothetical protein
LDPAWRREVVNTSVRALLSVAVTGREEGFNGNRNQQNSLSTMEHGKEEIGAEIRRRNKFQRLSSVASIWYNCYTHAVSLR